MKTQIPDGAGWSDLVEVRDRLRSQTAQLRGMYELIDRRILVDAEVVDDDPDGFSGAPPIEVRGTGGSGWVLAGVAGIAGKASDWAAAGELLIQASLATDANIAVMGRLIAVFSGELTYAIEHPEQSVTVGGCSGELFEKVTLDTPTGVASYTMPIALGETYGASEVGEILSPSGVAHRSLAQKRRQTGELLGVKIGDQFLYPKFQIDTARRCIRGPVAYANRALDAVADPWGTLDWWYTAREIFGGQRPADLAARDRLELDLVDLALSLDHQGMD